MTRPRQAGVYALLEGDRPALVHAWIGDDYELADLPEFLDTGRWQGELLVVRREEVAKLRIRAEAESFDHEEGLIQLCRDLDLFIRDEGAPELRLVELG